MLFSYKYQLRWIKYINAKDNSINCLEEDRQNTLGYWSGQNHLCVTLKPPTTKRKIDKWDYNKLNMCIT